MNLLLLEPWELGSDGRAVVGGRRAAHLVRVVGVRPGDALRVGVVRGGMGTARVVAIAGDRAELVVEALEPRPPPTVELVLAVPRPKALARSLETAASFGVARIDLVNAWRVEKSYFSSHRLDPARLRAALLVGCEQGMTTWLPDVEVHPLLVPFLERVLAPRLAAAPERVALLAHPPAARPIETALPRGAETPLVVAVGPEGGWIDREVESFASLGFVPVTLGAPILRVEAAIAALLAQLTLWRRMRSA